MRHTPLAVLFPWACCCFKKSRGTDYNEMMPLDDNDGFTGRELEEVNEQMDQTLNKIIKEYGGKEYEGTDML